MATIINQIQQDQAQRQALVNWHNDQLAIAMLKAVTDANLNRYEIAVIKKHLSGDINDRKLAYYLGRVTKTQA